MSPGEIEIDIAIQKIQGKENQKMWEEKLADEIRPKVEELGKKIEEA